VVELELPDHIVTTRRDGSRVVVLHRSLAVIGAEKVEIRNARSTAGLPLLGLALVIGAGTWVALTRGALPFWVLVALLFFCLIVAPIAVMGLVSALMGADVVVDGRKGLVTFQQGFLGMGIGTRELVPFGRIDHLEITIEGDEPDRWRDQADSLRQFALVLVKDNERHLTLAQIPVPASTQEDGMDRALATAQAIGAVAGARVDIPEGWELVEASAPESAKPSTAEPSPPVGKKQRRKKRSRG